MFKNENIRINKISFSGIYFLFLNKEIVYIGQSENIEKRVFQHLSRRKIIFDEWNYIKYPKELLNTKEADYILEYKPKYNNSIPSQNVWISKNQIRQIISLFDFNKLLKMGCFSRVEYLCGKTYVLKMELLENIKNNEIHIKGELK